MKASSTPYSAAADAAAVWEAACSGTMLRAEAACSNLAAAHARFSVLEAKMDRVGDDLHDVCRFLTIVLDEGRVAAEAGSSVHPTTMSSLHLLPRTLASKAEEGARARQRCAEALPGLRVAWACLLYTSPSPRDS